MAFPNGVKLANTARPIDDGDILASLGGFQPKKAGISGPKDKSGPKKTDSYRSPKKTLDQLSRGGEKKAVKNDSFLAGQVRPGSTVPLESNAKNSVLEKEDVTVNVKVRSGGREKNVNIPLKGVYVYRPGKDIDAKYNKNGSATKSFDGTYHQARQEARAKGLKGEISLPINGQTTHIFLSRQQANILRAARVAQ